MESHGETHTRRDRRLSWHAGLADMLDSTEVLVNLLPLASQTRGILNRETFARMRRGGYLIQVGRGEHLVEEDLLAALDSGHLAGAALDVFATEPLRPRHPFWRHPKIIVTPHDASDVSLAAIGATFLATADAGTGRPAATTRRRPLARLLTCRILRIPPLMLCPLSRLCAGPTVNALAPRLLMRQLIS